MPVTHTAVVVVADDGTSPVGSDEWNASHAVTDGSLTPAKVAFTATDKVLGRSTAGAGNGEELTVTAAGRALIDDADAAAQRSTLGLGTIATQNANAVAITGGSVTGITDVTVADGGTGASTAAAARTNLGIAGAVGGTEWTTVTKASDESVASSTSLQNDDELLFTTVNGGVYEIEILAIYVSPVGAGTPDFKVGVGEDSTARGVYSAITYLGAADATGTIASSGSQTNTGGISIGTAATNRLLIMRAWHVGAGGTFKFIWGQNTSSVDVTTVKAGSVLRYRRIL